MNLVIEQGNTATKVAIFEKGRLKMSFASDDFNVSNIASLFLNNDLRQGIMSTVTETDREITSFLEGRLEHFILLDENVPLPVKVQYQTPETLGKDRLAAVVGAHYLEPGKDILVIDAGTAITYELIEAAGVYLGGNISPGMTTRFKALNYYTKKLPLTKETEFIPFIGNTTETAIRAGVVYGICYEIDGYINDLRLKYPSLLVFLTGGHANYFAKRLKNIIFANINLVLVGLNRILEYNVENKESCSSGHSFIRLVSAVGPKQH
ncbi:MAG: type III pantothenate kinase [Tannerellaceae bacterium]|jgi:type III pantothenate kinase|nr:type III pantothenate kinase [Tannerellaceae bacterium]